MAVLVVQEAYLLQRTRGAGDASARALYTQVLAQHPAVSDVAVAVTANNNLVATRAPDERRFDSLKRSEKNMKVG
jgi:hypothetical protein